MLYNYINITCCRCKMEFGMPQDFYRSMKQLAEKGSFHCPAGHSQHFVSGETDKDILRRERDRLKQQLAEKDDYIKQKNDRIDALRKQNAAQKGVVTRIKNRVSHGVCPCCNRTFVNLMQHMKTKHPTYNKDEA